jgi:paraquat-inducible protein B
MSIGTGRLQQAADIRSGRRVSIIWAVPVLAVLIGAWLAWDTLSKQGPTITVAFDTAEGLQAGQSQLKFKDITFGTVGNIVLAEDHTHVLVTIATTAAAAPLLTDKTVFWVVKPRLFAGSLSGLGTLISGSYIAMVPGETAGKPARKFTGLEDPPVLQEAVPGTAFLLRSERLQSVSVGSPIFFRDLPVGEVLGWDVGDMAENVTIHAFVRAPYDRYIDANTRFWSESGISVKLAGGGIDVQLASLRALLLGGVAFETPQTAAAAQRVPDGHVFPLFANEDAARNASYTRKVPVVSYFPGSVAGLAPGDAVTMHGLKVGEVTDVRLSYDPAKHTVLAPVRYELQPERIVGIGKRAFPATETEAEVAQTMLDWGLRASLQSGNLLTGQQNVALDFVPDAPPTRVVMEGPAFVLPATSGAGFSGMQASAATLLQKVNTIPFDAIGKETADLLQNLNQISTGPQVKDTLASLATTMATLQQMVQGLNKGLAPASDRLPAMTASLQKTLNNANQLLASMDAGYGDNTRMYRNLDQLLVQLTETARSLQALSYLLTQHPEALVRGREGVP